MCHRRCMCHRSISPFLFVSRSMLRAMLPAPLCLLRPSVQPRVVPTQPEILTEVMKLLCRVYHSLSISFFELELARHPCLSATKHWIELNPCHIGLGDEGPMATSAFACRGFFSGLGVRQRMMPKIEKPPAVGLGKPLTVFDRYVETVELAVEIPSAGRFRPRAVRKRWIKNACQFFDDDGSFGKGTGLQIHIHIFFFYVYMMILGKSSLSVVETIGCQGGAHKNPPAIAGWQLQLVI